MATRPTVSSVSLELAAAFAAPLRSAQLPGFEISQVLVPSGPRGAPRLARDSTVTEKEVEVDLSEPDALTARLQGLASAKPAAPMAGAVLVADVNGTLTRRAEFSDALLTGLSLPLLDAGAKTSLTARVRWQPGRVAYAKLAGPQPKVPQSKRKKALVASNFRIAGLPFDGASALARVQLPEVVGQLTGLAGNGPLDYARIDIGDVVLTFAGAAARDAALDWALKLMGDGKISDGEFLSLDIEMLDAALKNVLLTFRLSGCALLGYQESRIDNATDSLPRTSLRLAVGTLELVFAKP